MYKSVVQGTAANSLQAPVASRASEGRQRCFMVKITGHRTDSVFRRYAIVDEEQKKQALASTATYLATAAHRKIAVMPAQKAS